MSKKQTGPSEHKTLPFYEIKTDADQGVVEHLIAIHGVIDEGKDMSHPGSFAKTLTERGHKVKVLDKHNTDSVLRVVGKPMGLEEVARDQLPSKLLEQYPEATGGVKATTQFLMDTPEGKGVFERIRAGAVDEFSYGYDALDFDYTTMKAKDGEEVEVRNLRTVKLYEYSPVIWGMNPATQTLSAKEATMEDELSEEQKDELGAFARDVRDDPTSDLTSIHRRFHMWAAKGNEVEGLGRSGMIRAHNIVAAELTRRCREENPDGECEHDTPLSFSGGKDEDEGEEAKCRSWNKLMAKIKKRLGKKDESGGEVKVEVTENYIRIPAGTGSHSGHRIRTKTLSEKKGIKALYCGECKEIVTYLFDKEKWELADAKAWVADHKSDETLTDRISAVQAAFSQLFQPGTDAVARGPYLYVSEVAEDYIIVDGEGRDYYKVSYTLEGDKVTFAPRDEWIEGDMVFAARQKPKGKLDEITQFLIETELEEIESI